MVRLKDWTEKDIEQCGTCFDSKMVRLKVIDGDEETIDALSFDSKMVRLKVK